jgi:hypothetical protein
MGISVDCAHQVERCFCLCGSGFSALQVAHPFWVPAGYTHSRHNLHEFLDCLQLDAIFLGGCRWYHSLQFVSMHLTSLVKTVRPWYIGLGCIYDTLCDDTTKVPSCSYVEAFDA